MLTGWFDQNKKDVDARQLYYAQFPNKYVWDVRQKAWISRTRGFSLGRIAYVHPAAGELYFLKMLLNHVKDLQAFNIYIVSLELFIQLFSLPAKHLVNLEMVKNGLKLFWKLC